jgi:hypothetical protein
MELDMIEHHGVQEGIDIRIIFFKYIESGIATHSLVQFHQIRAVV